MSFLSDREYILLMDCPTRKQTMMTVDELKAFADCGIQTAYWAGPVWDKYCSDDFKTFRPFYFEDYLERMRQAGLKCIIPLWHRQATYYPNDYYVSNGGGWVIGMFSPWNSEAQEKSNRMLKRIRDLYSSPTCLIVCAQADGGERVLQNKPAYYDAYAVRSYNARCGSGKPTHTTEPGATWLRESYTQLLLDQQRIMVETPHREIWFMLATYKMLIHAISCHGCEWIPDYLKAWQSLNPSSINHIIFNYFGQLKSNELFKIIKQEMDTFGVNEFVGVEYCEGLKAGNGRIAFEQGLRGLFVGPLHPFTKHDHVEPWMLREITNAHRMFEEKNNG